MAPQQAHIQTPLVNPSLIKEVLSVVATHPTVRTPTSIKVAPQQSHIQTPLANPSLIKEVLSVVATHPIIRILILIREVLFQVLTLIPVMALILILIRVEM